MTLSENIKIAALLTCHNRCEKTVRCLTSLFDSIQYFHRQDTRRLHLEIFLTDDGCTDNTVKAVKDAVKEALPLHIIKGDGNLFWSNGMIAAWREAMKQKWDYFLLLNDDVLIYENAIRELFDTEDFCLKEFSKLGIYSGITCDTEDKQLVTYGGYRVTNNILGKKKLLGASDCPQICDYTNANILLVPNAIVGAVGIFYDKYRHGCADNDYSHLVKTKGFPVLITSKACGECAFDHKTDSETFDKLCTMTFQERKRYFNNPVHSSKDQLMFCRRCTPLRFPVAYVGSLMMLYAPRFYRKLNNIRNGKW